jgi:hypothetical protein
MKNFKVLFLLMAFATLGLAITSCGNKKADAAAEVEAVEGAARGVIDGTADAVRDAADKVEGAVEEMRGPEYASAYVCPMHCKGSGSAQEGKCPACGMEYVRNETYNASDLGGEKKEEDSHEGHDHAKEKR